MEFTRNNSFDFIGKRNLAFIVSAIISVIGLIGIVRIATNTANLGIDFTGGTSIQLRFSSQVPLEQARALLSAHNLREVNLQEVREGNKLLVKVGKSGHQSDNAAATIVELFRDSFGDNGFSVESSAEIGPSIGAKLKKDTLTAVGISMVGIIIYIAWRFDVRFGIGAIVATLHDVLAMIALFTLLDREINLLFITAVLTIAGYSLTDTVVVFDRIRENIHKDLTDPLPDIFNRSINEVLSRTIITSLTTFLAALSLYLFGGDVISDFALALVTGVAIATYSSIFIASPVVLELEKWQRRRQQQ